MVHHGDGRCRPGVWAVAGACTTAGGGRGQGLPERRPAGVRRVTRCRTA
jgi:hypothetical protein